MEFRREAPTLLAAAAPPDPRLDEELAFIEVSNALAALAPTKSRSIAPTSPWVVRSVPALPCVPDVYVATREGAGESRLMVVTALLAMLVGIPVAALAISFIY
jgi:hypothetical protein